MNILRSTNLKKIINFYNLEYKRVVSVHFFIPCLQRYQNNESLSPRLGVILYSVHSVYEADVLHIARATRSDIHNQLKVNQVLITYATCLL